MIDCFYYIIPITYKHVVTVTLHTIKSLPLVPLSCQLPYFFVFIWQISFKKLHILISVSSPSLLNLYHCHFKIYLFSPIIPLKSVIFDLYLNPGWIDQSVLEILWSGDCQYIPFSWFFLQPHWFPLHSFLCWFLLFFPTSSYQMPQVQSLVSI